jgi:glycosyltransferase involved in cell wall biosynthesis
MRTALEVETSKGPDQCALVSVGMTTYNGELFVDLAIQSLLNQNYSNLEIIISDDCSTDSTVEICSKHAARDERIRLLRHARNRGIIENFNVPLAHAKGQYFFWASQDDLWEPAFVEQLVRLLESDSEAGAAFCQFDNIDGDGRLTRQYPQIASFSNSDPFLRVQRFIEADERSGKPNFLHSLIRIDKAKQSGPIGVFGTGLWFDTVFSMKLLSLGNIVFSPDVLFHKRNHDNATSIRNTNNTYTSLRGVIKELLDSERYFRACDRAVDSMDLFSDDQRHQLKSINARRRNQQRQALLLQIPKSVLRRTYFLLRQTTVRIWSG